MVDTISQGLTFFYLEDSVQVALLDSTWPPIDPNSFWLLWDSQSQSITDLAQTQTSVSCSKGGLCQPLRTPTSFHLMKKMAILSSMITHQLSSNLSCSQTSNFSHKNSNKAVFQIPEFSANIHDELPILYHVFRAPPYGSAVVLQNLCIAKLLKNKQVTKQPGKGSYGSDGYSYTPTFRKMTSLCHSDLYLSALWLCCLFFSWKFRPLMTFNYFYIIPY